MADPLSITAVFAFLNSAVKFSELAVKIYSVDSENGVFVRMIQTVRQDLEETERLLSVPSVRAQLISTPAKLPWIKAVIISTKSALNEIGRWVERVRGDKEGYGTVSWDNRIRWVFNDHEKLVNRRMELGSSHQALSNVLMYLSPLEQAAVATAEEPPEYQDATFLDAYISPAQRRKNARMSQKSSIQLRKEETISDATGFQAKTVIDVPYDDSGRAGAGNEGLPISISGNTISAEETWDPTHPHHWYPENKTAMASKEEQSPPPCGYRDVPPISPTSSSPLPNSTWPSRQQSHSSLTILQEECPVSTSTQTVISQYPQPWFQKQVSSNSQVFDSVSTVSAVSTPLISNEKSLPELPPKLPLEAPRHRFSATSFGPVDPYDFKSELEVNGQDSCIGDPKDREPAEPVAEMMDNASLHTSHTISVNSHAELPASSPDVQPAWLNSTTATELPSWSQARSSWNELPGSSIPFTSSSTGNVSTDQEFLRDKAQTCLPNSHSQYSYPAQLQSNVIRHRASSYTPTHTGISERVASPPLRTRTMNNFKSPYIPIVTNTSPQLSRPQSQYKPYRVSNQVPEAQTQRQSTPTYQYQSPNQYPYLHYQTPSEAPTSRPVSAASTLPPYPVDFKDQQPVCPTPVSPEAPPALPAPKEGEPQSPAKSVTLMEARMRNQKVMLEIMSRESFG